MDKFCIRSSATAELFFDDCAVPAENLIGEEGRGFVYVMECLDGSRISHAGTSIGLAQAAYEASMNYSRQRVQFGQPIYKFQTNSFKLARMATEIEAARWLMYRAASLHDQGMRRFKEAAMAKLIASEGANTICRQALSIFGGYGLMKEYPAQRFLRDSFFPLVGGGTSDIMKVVISKEMGI